jgi:hypothetical protein
MANSYREEIEKLKSEAFDNNVKPENQGTYCLNLIDRAASLGLLEGKRQQHEKDVATVKGIRSWADLVVIEKEEVVEALESTKPV